MRIEIKVNRLVKHVYQSQDGFGFECVCLGGWCKFYGLTTEQTKARPSWALITSHAQWKIVPKFKLIVCGCIINLFLYSKIILGI